MPYPGHFSVEINSLPRIGGPSARRIIDVAAICLGERERAIGLNAGDRRKCDRDWTPGRIVFRRFNEHRIDRHARHRAGVLDLHFDPGDDSRQSTQRDRKAVSSKRAPDFEPIQQSLSVYRDGVPIVEFLPPSKHATGQIP